ncbi:hypothetical protein IWW57_005003, partial [Coemansia sp. S610]
HGDFGGVPNLRVEAYGALNDMAPPSPPQTHRSSSESLFSATAHPRGRPTYTVYLDNVATLSNYQVGLSTDASQRDSLSLSWQRPAIGDSERAAIYVCQDEYSGPWFAAQHCSTSLVLDPDHVLPFLNSELNLNRLTRSPSDQDRSRHLPCTQEDGETLRALKREQMRSAQKIQKKIIMGGLAPVLVAAEDRVEYVYEEDPALRVVLRRNVRMMYKDCASDSGFSCANGKVCDWIEKLVDDDDHTDSTLSAEALGFDLLEVHFGHAGGSQPPDWLARLFFDSALVRPILDFDLYLHGIATLRPDSATDFPYWLVDCSWKHLETAQPPHCPSRAESMDLAADSVVDIPADYSSETTHLLHISASPSQLRRDGLRPRTRSSSSRRYRSMLAMLLLATVV